MGHDYGVKADVSRRRLWLRLARGMLAGICLAAVWPAAAAEAGTAPVMAFRGLGTWVDLYDGAVRADPETAVAQMRADGVRTLYLETSNFTATAGIVAPDIVSRFIVAAHADGLRVVGWYLPSFARPGLDRDRALAAVRFRTPGGQAFDAVALDIESTRVRAAGLRTSRLLDLAAALRSGAGAGYPLGAIVPAPEGMHLNPGYWPGFPFRPLRGLFTAFLPMDYFTYHETTAAGAHDYTAQNVALLRQATGDPGVPIHLIGGIADVADDAQVAAFVHAARERGVLGASLYDYATTSPAEWTLLAQVPMNPRQPEPLPLRLPAPAAYGHIPGADGSHPKEVFYAASRLTGAVGGALPRLRSGPGRGAAVGQLAVRAHAAAGDRAALEPVADHARSRPASSMPDRRTASSSSPRATIPGGARGVFAASPWCAHDCPPAVQELRDGGRPRRRRVRGVWIRGGRSPRNRRRRPRPGRGRRSSRSRWRPCGRSPATCGRWTPRPRGIRSTSRPGCGG